MRIKCQWGFGSNIDRVELLPPESVAKPAITADMGFVAERTSPFFSDIKNISLQLLTFLANELTD
ncbi:MAG: hypothetical protein KAS94_03070, partial [Desulfobulbaceae bacterium]|nr:hypothetical protein [Desulfobulbaceae bacterium]